MRFKRLLADLGKVLLSGILAFALLMGFCVFYYNIPAHQTDESGATDYKWTSDTFYSRGTEGFAWGRTNNEGYLNLFDYTANLPIDILILGSSHMEAYHVLPEQSTASRLNSMLDDKTVYNIGISSHNFLVCADNLEAALNEYKPSEYIVIETSALCFSDEALSLALQGKVETKEIQSRSQGIIWDILQKSPYLRLLYKQARGFMDMNGNAEDGESNDETGSPQTANNEELLNSLLQKMGQTASASGAALIIAYHPSTAIESDGSLSLGDNDTFAEQFSRLCSDNGILFLDMSQRFTEEYYSNHILPHGFCNSSVGSGHLNKYGHEMMAEELYKLMEDK